MSTGSTADRALETAMEWLLAIEAAPADPALRSNLDAWLAADPAHARAWDRARAAWAIMEEVPPRQGTPWKTRRPGRSPARRGARTLRRRRAGFAAAAVAAACFALVLAPTLALRLRADHTTATGELRTVTLEDGSRVALGPRSAITTDYAEGERRVTLLAGEAWFDVTRNPARPFVVKAGGVDTRVLGTAFEVQLGPDATAVAVERGLVGVRAAAGQAGTGVLLHPGERVSVDRASGVETRGLVPADSVASWRTGALYADNATVADVVERLRAYDDGWIVITDDALARRRVTGLYAASEPDAAMAALLHAGGGRMRKVTPWLTLLSAE